MNLFDLTFMSIGGIIGAGIFSMVGSGVASTGRSVTLALLVGMIFMMTQQVRYVFTASMFQLSGGTYSQDALVLTPLLTGVSATMLVINSLNRSAFGISMASYLADLFPVLRDYQTLTACLVLLFFFIIGSTGAQIFAKAINALGILKFIALGLFIFFGITKVVPGGFEGEPYFYGGTVSFLTAIALMSFACNGATNIMNVQAIAAHSKRDIPRAWFLASVIVAIVYALLGYVASGVAPYSQVAGQNLGFIAEMIMPAGFAAFFIIGGAMCSLSTALLGGIAATPFTLVGMAEDGWLPKIFRKRINVIIFLFIVSIAPVIGGFTLDDIISMVLVPSMIVTAVKNIKGMRLPEMFPEEWAKSELKCSPTFFRFLMVISIITSLMTSFFSLRNLTLPLAIGSIVMSVVVFVWPWFRLKQGCVKIVSTADMDPEVVEEVEEVDVVVAE